jgi:CspA family cold shock protein
VLQFDQARGYGFVAAEDGGEDIFLHASVFDGDPDVLVPGVKIRFQVMAGDRGRKAFGAHLAADEPGPEVRPIPVPPPNPPLPESTLPVSAAPDDSDAPDDEQMCDVLSHTEFKQELTELLLTAAPPLSSPQILGVRQCIAEFAQKHGWVDI